MSKLKSGAGLCLAIVAAFAASYGTGRAQPPATATAAPAAAPAVAAADAELATRRAALLRLIEVGRAQGWLDRADARAAYQRLRANRGHEAEMRAAAAGRLSAADGAVLNAELDSLAHDLRWSRSRFRHTGYRHP